MEKKVCKKCGATKTLEFFAKRSKEKYHTYCQECANASAREYYTPELGRRSWERKKENNHERVKEQNNKATKKYRAKNIDWIRAKGRENAKNREQKYDKEKALKWVRKWQKKNKHKLNAAAKARRAVKLGKIIKPNYCQICGDEAKLQNHHHDYSKPLEVIFVCRMCHGLMDRVRRKYEGFT